MAKIKESETRTIVECSVKPLTSCVFLIFLKGIVVVVIGILRDLTSCRLGIFAEYLIQLSNLYQVA